MKITSFLSLLFFTALVSGCGQATSASIVASKQTTITHNSTGVSSNTQSKKPGLVLLNGSKADWITGVQLRAVNVPMSYKLVNLRASITFPDQAGGENGTYQASFSAAYQNGRQELFPNNTQLLSLPDEFMTDVTGRRISFGIDHAQEGSAVVITAIFQDSQGKKITLVSGKVYLQ